MQGKGFVKFFSILLAVVCLVQFLLILPTRAVENRAEAYASAKAAKVEADQQYETRKLARVKYLDSISKEEIFRIPMLKSYTYDDLKKQQLALGLDLKGGMSVLLQVDLRDFLKSLSNESKDENFTKAIDNAYARLKNAQSDYITLFAEEYRKLAGNDKLAALFSRNQSLSGEINFESPDAEVLRVIRAKANETVDLTFKRLKDRIDKFGVIQPNVSLDASRDLIVVELPGVDNPERARKYLQASAKLEFRDVYRITDAGLVSSFIEADKRLGLIQKGQTIAADSTGMAADTALANKDTAASLVDNGPLFSLLTLNSTSGQAMTAPLSVMGTADGNKKAQISQYLDMPEIKSLFPRDLIFRWSYKPITDPTTNEPTNRFELYAVKLEKGSEKAPLEGDVITNAQATPDQRSGETAVSLQMNPKGAKTWGQMTTRAYNDGNREIAILLDDEVVSAPRVINPITSGDSQITGNFDIQEAKDLANILQIGKLPAKTEIIQESLVGPTLGKENISKSISSITIGFLLVLVFMVLYYGQGGFVSIIALLANIFFIIGILTSMGTVLTLPGIAGLVLTMGMAVDANVIIYERIKEEIRAGKAILTAIKEGFIHSYSAIVDGQLTTLLTGIILAYYGLGPIKGFAVVLCIGILTSLFANVLLTHLIIDYWTGKGKGMTFMTNFSKNFFTNVNFDFMKIRKVMYMVSGTLTVLGIISMFTRGFELGVDFKGGYSYNVEFAKNETIKDEDLRKELTKAFGNASTIVKAVNTQNTFNVTTSYNIDDASEEADEKTIAALHQGVNSLVQNKVDLENFKKSDATGTHVTSYSKVGPTVADDIKDSAWWATIIALLGIFVYILFRFSKWQYSLGAIVATGHDAFMVLGLFSLLKDVLPFSMEVDQAFIAALLTVIGYSVNDTVIVFDRIREYARERSFSDKYELINKAINSTLGRTTMTSLTTLFTVLVLFLFGGSSIKGFSFALVIGIVIGTYSSIFIASPIMADLTKDLIIRKKTSAAATSSKQKV